MEVKIMMNEKFVDLKGMVIQQWYKAISIIPPQILPAGN